MGILNNLEVINILKRTPSNVFINGVGHTLPKVTYVESDNYLIINGKSSKYIVQLVLPFDSILKESDFITFITNEYASGQMQDNHKFALLTVSDLNMVVHLETRLTNQRFTLTNGIIDISHWEPHPSVDITLEGENGQKVELYPLPNEIPFDIKKTISYKLIGKSNKKANHAASILKLSNYYSKLLTDRIRVVLDVTMTEQQHTISLT